MKNYISAVSLRALALSSIFVLAACGGGGGGSIVAPPPTTGGGGGSTGPTWTQGVFEDEGQFKNRCESPRSGSSPHTGNAYPDIAGSTLEEMHWLRSWSDRTYLWYNEITDQNPANFSDRLAYFDVLKTEATTASGAPRDKFHFTIPTDEYEQSVSSGASAGYGARFRLIASSPPREIVVAYNEPGSPAEAAGLVRGSQILEIDGEDAINGSNVSVLNAGLFPDSEGESHTFVIREPGSTTNKTITMTSEVVTTAPVRATDIITRPNGDRVGYMLFNTFGTTIAEDALFDAFTSFSAQGLDDLVLDLRYNGGGFLALSSELAYMVAGATATNNKTYETLVFNDKHPTTNPVTGDQLSPTPFYNTTLGFTTTRPQGTPLPTLNLPRVFVLSTGGTCSASESFVNALIGIDVEVILIGDTTCGKPYGFYATDNCGETYFTIQFRGENDKGFGDYSDGFSPSDSSTVVGESVTGCSVADDFSKQLGDSTEALLSTALSYIDNGSCPTVTTKPIVQSKIQLDNEGQYSLLDDPRIRNREMLDSSRILNLPQ